ncbi:ATP-dependent RNA helicase HrpA [Gammaproteobacteria bacterium]|nr:ATP-dependent RNA helicase HrpA [Gammaproteobacteria bacterium]
MKKNTPDYIEKIISQGMLADRFSLRSNLKKKHLRDLLIEDARRSSAEANRRKSLVPRVSIPKNLPIAKVAGKIKKAFHSSQVVIVAGETGSGKSTQLGKICLDLGQGVFGMIGHTQPRRVAARAVASRVASELGVSLGEEVGFQVRFDVKTNPNTLIKVMTDGILLSEIEKDPFLEKYDTLIIDEVHERTLNIDFLLGYLKKLMKKRVDLKLIITSATIDVDRFSKYFSDAPKIEVSGRMFPVEVKYRSMESNLKSEISDNELILEVLEEIWQKPKGDVLVFLPGEREIRELSASLEKHKKKFEVCPLFSRLSSSEQDKIFEPHTGRRVILSTNLAETSLTVPGVRYVIDPGFARVSRYSHRLKVQKLHVEEISRASADQRKGRCGRLEGGVCFRLFSEENFSLRPTNTTPEIQRTNLASVVLKMLQIKLGEIDRFPFLDPPSEGQVNAAFALLTELNAVDKFRKLTKIGKKMSGFPLDVRFSRMLISAAQFGSSSEILTIVSGLSIRDPRERPEDYKNLADRNHKKWEDRKSDFLTYLNLWDAFEEKKNVLSKSELREYCRTEFLSLPRMLEWRQLRLQLLRLAKSKGLRVNSKKASYAAIHKAILSGLLGNIAKKSGENEYLGARNKKHYIFPGSSQFSARPTWIVSAEILETTRTFARGVAHIDRAWIEPLAGHIIKRSYRDPCFEPESGQVLATEEVSLYGIKIEGERKVDFGSINLENARKIYIQNALVKRLSRTKLSFFKKNLRLLSEAETGEAKTRRSDILISEAQVYDIYESSLPANVCSDLDLHKLIKHKPEISGQLELRPEEVFSGNTLLELDEYPDYAVVEGNKLPLRYRFEPGAPEDGVTIDIPLKVLSLLKKERVDWLVPGTVRDKCIGLIKSLPKKKRKNFIPLSGFIDRVLKDFHFCGKTLEESLAERLFMLSGIRIRKEDFKSHSLEPHLKTNLRILSNEGKPLGVGRDLDALKNQFLVTGTSETDKALKHSIEGVGYTDWSFGLFPESIEVNEGNIKLILYPSIKDCGDSVSLELRENRDIALKESERGFFRLCVLRLHKIWKDMSKQIPRFDEFSIFYVRRGNRKELIEGILTATFNSTFSEGQPLPRNSLDFEKRLGKKSDLYANLALVADYVETCLRKSMLIEDALPYQTHPETCHDISMQLENLMPKKFPSALTLGRLREYPRYLNGILYRLEKLGLSSQQELGRIEKIGGWWERYCSIEIPVNDKVTNFRWILEEYRISLFAQSLGTKVPVSEKRLEKEWQKLSVGEVSP